MVDFLTFWNSWCVNASSLISWGCSICFTSSSLVMIASLSRRFLKWHNLLQFIQVRFIYSLFFAVGLYYPFFSRFSFCYEVYKSPTIAVSVGLHSYTQFFCQGFSRKDGGKLAPTSFSLLVDFFSSSSGSGRVCIKSLVDILPGCSYWRFLSKMSLIGFLFQREMFFCCFFYCLYEMVYAFACVVSRSRLHS